MCIYTFQAYIIQLGGFNMEIRTLNYFLTVARMQSFSKAAQELHITQPTLSRQIKELEDQYHVTLFNVIPVM